MNSRPAVADGADRTEQPEAASARGGFFAVDRRTWAKVCSHSMNEAVAYLVIARGTGADNKTSCWSVDAIERYTGISRGRAKASVDHLKQHDCLRILRDGTRPKYELTPAGEIPGLVRPRLDDGSCDGSAAYLYQQICDGKMRKRLYQHQQMDLQRLLKGRWVKDLGDGSYAPMPASEIKADPIWLPNELVTGAAEETPPIELIRQMQDVMTLRLFVDYYGVHDLREDGGVPRQFTFQKYNRLQSGSWREFVVWAFERGVVNCYPATDIVRPHCRDLTKKEKAEGKIESDDFFRRQDKLADVGLIQWRPHLVESEDPAAEIIHPYGMAGDDGDIEDRIGAAAHRAGMAMLTEAQRQWVVKNNLWLAPVPAHMTNVTMVDVARLRYRPRTRRTAAWFADLSAKADRFIAHYETRRRQARG
jgi:hypothetical protein